MESAAGLPGWAIGGAEAGPDGVAPPGYALRESPAGSTASFPTRRSLRGPGATATLDLEAPALQPRAHAAPGQPSHGLHQGQGAGSARVGRAARRRAESSAVSSRTVTRTGSVPVRPGSAEPARRGRAMVALKVGCLAAVAVLGVVIMLQHNGSDALTTVAATPTATGSQWASSAGSGRAGPDAAAPGGAFLAGPGSSAGPAGSAVPGPVAGSVAASGSGSAASGMAAKASSRGSLAGVAGAGASGIAVQPGANRSPAAVPASGPRVNQAGGTMSLRMYGPTRSGLPWHSGLWLGGTKSTERINQAGDWRGRPMDFATAYPLYASWSDIADPSSCIGLFAGFKGKLALGLPLLPSDRAGQWDDILSGSHDDVFRTVARNLKSAGFGDSAVRVGLEANGDWFPWGVNASNAAQYKAAFRRVVGIMRTEAPQLSFWFDTSAAANPLPGTTGRADMFDVMYPGDDVVDGISMDHYDFYSIVAHNASEFAAAIRPDRGAGLADAADFARKHGKGFAVPEWGLHAQQGAGDNPYFFTAMYGFFQQNKDILVYEDYFNENAAYIGASIWDPVQNPQSSVRYRQLWGS